MSANKRRYFYTWYETVSGSTLNFAKEGPVDLDIIIRDMSVDPLSSVTIASACMKVFWIKFLTVDTLESSQFDRLRQFYVDRPWFIMLEHILAGIGRVGDAEPFPRHVSHNCRLWWRESQLYIFIYTAVIENGFTHNVYKQTIQGIDMI